MKKMSGILLALLSLVSFSAYAGVPQAVQAVRIYQLFAKTQNPNVVISAEAGKAFYNKKILVEGKEIACADCHTQNPADKGKNIRTGMSIQPMAPAVNQKRFENLNESEKAFTKHCQDLYKKNCTPEEKGNFVKYLLSTTK